MIRRGTAYKECAEIDIIPETANAIRPQARQEVKAPRGEGMLDSFTQRKNITVNLLR